MIISGKFCLTDYGVKCVCVCVEGGWGVGGRLDFISIRRGYF